MGFFLVIAFIVVPLVELSVIGQVNAALGLPWTLTLLLLDSMAGAWLVKREGSKAWTALREAMTAGRVPGDELLEGALLLFGGALLLTPGFVTDGLGLALVLPITRRPIAKIARTRFVDVRMQGTSSQFGGIGGAGSMGFGAFSANDDAAEGREAPVIEVLSIEREEPSAAELADEG